MTEGSTPGAPGDGPVVVGPIVVGVVGGIASGKSVVAQELERLGARRFDADQAGHSALQDGDVQRRLRETFGPDVFAPDGRVDRAALAAQVFGDGGAAAAREQLEAIVHPNIGRQFQEWLSVERREAAAPLLVVDAPLLVEAGWAAACDRVVFVDAPRDDRLARAKARGWSEEQFDAREAAQASLPVKRAASSDVLTNDGSLADLKRKTAEWFHGVATES